MLKKLISLCLIFAMVMAISPAVMAEEEAPRPTVEEILSEYHQKAFAAEYAEANDTVSTYALRSGSSGKTLEEETVETLNAAGYEAYNVTSANYKELETQLHTDFAEMGLDPNSSYIITIGGEDPQNTSSTFSYGDNLITPTLPPDVGGSTGNFTFTYGGTEYIMRYVTVTSADNTEYRKSSDYDMLANYSDTFLDRLFSTAAETYLDALCKYVPLGTVLSILGIPDYASTYRTKESSLSYFACTTWTRSYIQVWNSFYGDWTNASCAEYVEMKSKLSGYVYNVSTGSYVDVDDKQITKTEYSADYYNYEQRKIDAVIGYVGKSVECDVVGSVTYYHGSTVVAYHHQNF